MRINRAIIAALSIAMLAFTFLACEDDNSKDIKSVQMPDGRIWMAKNLDIATGKSECYDKDPANCQKCGRLYDWETAIKACPKGWRLPTDAELSDLAGAIGGAEVGKALKSKESWDGTDAYGFSVLPCGRGLDGKFDRMGDMGALWSADEINAQKSWVYGIINADNKAYKDSVAKARLYSVRCIKDEAKPVATEQAKAPEQKKPATASSPEEVASLYVASGAKMDIETMKKITTGQMLEKMLLTESMLRMTASSAGKSYESYLKELQTETISRGELVIKSATKASDDGKHARVIVYAGKKGDALEVPTAIVLAKDGGKWKVIDTPK